MYAYGRILIDHPNVRVVPREAIVELGEQMYCYLLRDGKAIRTEVQTGIGDDSWIELSGKEIKLRGPDDKKWTELTGTEEVIMGDLTELSDGERVHVVQ